MSFTDEMVLGLWNCSDPTIKIIDRWKPEGCESEKDYENSLASFIREALPSHEVTQQYGLGRGTIDICIGHQVGIEIKKDLQRMSFYHNLSGQMTEYSKSKGVFIILVIGKADPDLLVKVQKHAKDLSWHHAVCLVDDSKVKVVQKH